MNGTSEWSPEIDDELLNSSIGRTVKWTKQFEEKAVKDCGDLILRSQPKKKRETGKHSICIWPWVLILAIVGLSLIRGCNPAWAMTASYYTKNSCIKEGTSGIWTASGERYDENTLTCASWDFAFGTKLMVTNLENGKTVNVMVNDRGPSRRLYRMGRRLDLSPVAFRAISPSGTLKEGLIKVTVEAI